MLGCLGPRASSVSRGGLEMYLWSGRLGWWFTSLGRWYFLPPPQREGCAPVTWVSHCAASLGKVYSWCWKGSCSRLLNLRFRRNNMDSILVVEQQINFLPLQSCWGAHASLPLQSTCVSRTWRRLTTGSPGEYCGVTVGVWCTRPFATGSPAPV